MAGHATSDRKGGGEGPWACVVEFLGRAPPDDGSGPGYQLTAAAQYTLEECLDTGGRGTDRAAMAMPPFAGNDTPLGAARRRRLQLAPEQNVECKRQKLKEKSSSTAGSNPASTAAQPKSDGTGSSLEWATALLASLSRMESPGFASASRVWRLPSADLARVCRESLKLDGCTGPALADFILAALSDPAVSLENQCLLLRCAAACAWFVSEEAVPAIVQSQLTALLQSHSQAIAMGLLLPLLEAPDRLSLPTAAMIAKLVKSDMPTSASELLFAGVIAISRENPHKLCDSVFQVMEALVAAIPAGKLAAATGKSCIEMLHLVAPANRSSKKLSVLMLHIVNKLGGSLSSNDLDQIATAASILETPLRKAIISTANRKKSKQPGAAV
ncbi:hypothetical protein GQ54DRAFT_55871 [Martensiomyces pterosporus]|nr:hypothetical protein GQ54DRAFT_55871 [Martensiomyces pterosporus]